MKLFCNVTRGGNIESRHEVYAIAIDEDGKAIFSIGSPDYITCIRSSLKPFQASAVIKAGAVETAGFIEEEIALMCASHNGEEIHVKTAQGMAKKLGLDVSHYECGSHPPYNPTARNKACKNGFTPFHNNCSGKHSGMLALAQHLSAGTKDYINFDHPVQKTIMDQLKSLTGKKELLHGIDGCSAPTPFLSLKEIALLFQELGFGNYPELNIVYRVMTSHPYLIGGKDRFDTDFNVALKGRGVTKIGGEAIRGMVIKTEKYGVVGIAQKTIDGGMRTSDTAIMAILNHLHLLTLEEKTQLISYEKKKLFDHSKKHIGNIVATLN